MAKGGGGKKRTYVRDGNGRFASTPGGGKPALKGGTLAKRTSLKKSRANLRAKDAADPSIRNTLSTRAQKGAVTRGDKALRAAKASSQRTAVGRSKVGTLSKTKKSPVLKTTVLKTESARVPAAQRPGSITNTLRGAMAALAKADAQRIREIESITGQKVRPTAAGTKAGKEAGARVRATAKKGKMADTLRAGLRELAQSDARTMRGMAEIVRDATPKVSGGKSGKALKGAKKALPAAKAATTSKTASVKTKGERIIDRIKANIERASRESTSKDQERKLAKAYAVSQRALYEVSRRGVGSRDPNKQYNRKDLLPVLNKSLSKPLPKKERKSTAKSKKDSTRSELSAVASLAIAARNRARKKGTLLPPSKESRRAAVTPATPKPPTRTKGSRASLPRTRGTVAKPKGLKPGTASKAPMKPLKGVGAIVARNLQGFKGMPVQIRSRKQAAKAYKLKTNTLGNKTAASRGFNAAVGRRDAFADSTPRLVFRRGKNQQITLTGGVESVKTGRMKQVGERAKDGSIRRSKAKPGPIAGSKSWKRNVERHMRSGDVVDPWLKAAYERRYGKSR
jgi:hypothetical protein